MNLYRRVEMPSDEPVQVVGVHPLRWYRRTGEPTDGFVEVDNDLTTMLESCQRERDAMRQRLKLEDGVLLLSRVRELAYDSGWLAAKIELGHSSTPESDNLDLRTLIERRDSVYWELAAALAGGEGE